MPCHARILRRMQRKLWARPKLANASLGSDPGLFRLLLYAIILQSAVATPIILEGSQTVVFSPIDYATAHTMYVNTLFSQLTSVIWTLVLSYVVLKLLWGYFHAVQVVWLKMLDETFHMRNYAIGQYERLTRFLFIEYGSSVKYWKKQYEGKTAWCASEYIYLRDFFIDEYGLFVGAAANFVVFLKHKINEYMWLQAASVVLTTLGQGGSVLKFLFRRNTFDLFPQGLRSSTNRASMFMTGLFSFALVLLAPIFGAERMHKLVQPVLNVLKNVPYATWFCDWLKKWFRGDVQATDLPQDQKSWEDDFKKYKEESNVRDAVEDLEDVDTKYHEKVDLRRQAVHFVYVDKLGDTMKESTFKYVNTKTKKSTRGLSDAMVVSVVRHEWKMCPTAIICNDKEFVSPDSFTKYMLPVMVTDASESDSDSEVTNEEETNDNPGGAWPEMEKGSSTALLSTVNKSTLVPKQELDEQIKAYNDLNDHVGFNMQLHDIEKTTPDVIPKDAPIERINTALETFMETTTDKKGGVLLHNQGKSDDDETEDLNVELNKAHANLKKSTVIIRQIEQSDTLWGQFVGILQPIANWWDCFHLPDRVLEARDFLYAAVTEIVANPRKAVVSPSKRLRKFWKYFGGGVLAFALLGAVLGGVRFSTRTDVKKKSVRRSFVTPTKEDLDLTLQTFREMKGRIPLGEKYLDVDGPLCDDMIELFEQEQERLYANPQFSRKGRGKYPNLKRHHVSRKKRDFEPSGGSEKSLEYANYTGNNPDYERKIKTELKREADHEPVKSAWIDFQEDPTSRRANRAAGRTERVELKHKAVGQALPAGMNQPALPTMVPDFELRRAIYKARKRVVVAKCDEVKNFLKEMNVKFEPKFQKEHIDRVKEAKVNFRGRLEPQSWNPKLKAGGVFKAYVNGKYVCTATLVAGKMWMVTHGLSDDITAKYEFVNSVHTLLFSGKDICLVKESKELVYFKVSGIKCVFNVASLQIPTESCIVAVYGFGSDDSIIMPDVVPGFASPLGWCNAKTRNGDCSSPVLNDAGKIIGFWTHGNGETFGCFEPVTAEFINLHKGVETPHVGLDFRLNPPHQQNL